MADFNPYEAPQADFRPVRHPESGEGLWQDGRVLVARSEAEFPDICIKCTAPAEGYRFKRTLRWHPRYYFLIFFLVSPIIYAIVAPRVARWGRIEAGLCQDHRDRRRNAILAGWGLAVLGIVLLIAGIDRESPELVIAGSILLLGGIVYGIARSRVLVTERIDRGFVRLKKVDPGFLAALPRWNP